MKKQKKIFYIEVDSAYFINNRLELACYMLGKGYEVHVATILSSHEDKTIIISKGIMCHFQSDTKSSSKYIYKKIKLISPDIIHIFTINASAKIGLFLLLYKKCKIILSVTGLGFTFISNSLYAKAIRIFLMFLIPMINIKHDVRFILQNEDDKTFFIEKYRLKENKVFLISGSGVNIDKFYPSNINNDIPKILFVGRLLKDKGIYEFINASKIVNKNRSNAKFIIAGTIDKKNPASLSEQEIEEIKKMPFVDYKGYIKNTDVLLRDIDIACLPSYREGLSKFLIEAGASGKPIITTDVPGCKEVVENGKNGFLVPVKNAVALSDALEVLCIDSEKRKRMGEESRKIIENKFAMNIIVKKTSDVYTDF